MLAIKQPGQWQDNAQSLAHFGLMYRHSLSIQQSERRSMELQIQLKFQERLSLYWVVQLPASALLPSLFSIPLQCITRLGKNKDELVSVRKNSQEMWYATLLYTRHSLQSLPHFCQRGFFPLLPSVYGRSPVDSCPAQTVQLFRKSPESNWRRNHNYRHQLLLKIKGRIQVSSTAPWLASHSMCLESLASNPGWDFTFLKDGPVLFVYWPTSFQDERGKPWALPPACRQQPNCQMHKFKGKPATGVLLAGPQQYYNH